MTPLDKTPNIKIKVDKVFAAIVDDVPKIDASLLTMRFVFNSNRQMNLSRLPKSGHFSLEGREGQQKHMFICHKCGC